jgi:transcriptional regulator with XRE-family HTH domain
MSHKSNNFEPNYDLVRERLSQTRKYRGLNLRDAAKEIGVSAPTLSRIERGASRPDIPTLDALIRWLGLERSTVYNARPPATAATPDEVRALLQQDENLDAQSAEALAAIFRTAYDTLSRGQSRRRKT